MNEAKALNGCGGQVTAGVCVCVCVCARAHANHSSPHLLCLRWPGSRHSAALPETVEKVCNPPSAYSLIRSQGVGPGPSSYPLLQALWHVPGLQEPLRSLCTSLILITALRTPARRTHQRASIMLWFGFNRVIFPRHFHPDRLGSNIQRRH